MRSRLLFATLLTAAAATACSPVEDELAAEDLTELSDEKADATSTYTYFTVAPDLRRCAFPHCGGFWVARVNRTTTNCGGGVFAERCYVAEADWARLGLEAGTVESVRDHVYQGGLVVRATIGQRDYGAAGKLALLRPTEAWLGLGPGQPDGVFVKIQETGVRCFTTPCPFWHEHKLNGSGTASLAELGWDASGADEDAVGRGVDSIIEHDLIISGDRYTVRGPGGSAKARSVTQFYVRAVDPEPTAP